MIEISDYTLIQILQQNNNLIIDCWAEWCGPCKAFDPIFKEITEENTSISFAKVNVDECPDASRKLDVKAIPTILFFKNGNLVDRIVGTTSKEDMINRIRKHYEIY